MELVTIKCVVKGYQECRFDVGDVEDNELFEMLKKIGEKGRAFRVVNERGLWYDGFVAVPEFNSLVSCIQPQISEPAIERVLWILFACVQFPNPNELSSPDWVRLGSINSIKFD